jgi:hypothetical protein
MKQFAQRTFLYLLLLTLSVSNVNCQSTNKGRFYKGEIDTKMPIESKYKEMGCEQVAKVEFHSDNPKIEKIVAVYPLSMTKSIKALPLVNIGNASNTTAYDLLDVMEHLASWGYVVIGNMDKQTGTGLSISNIISPEAAFQANFDETTGAFPVLAARNTKKDHEEMGGEGDPYMTAWLSYFLQGDSAAGKAFMGANAEILKNSERWSDIKRKKL